MSISEMTSFISFTSIPEDVGYATFFWHLYDKHMHTDVEFDLLGPEGPVTFSAHKIILSLWSPYFADKFFCTKEKKIENAINILQFNDVNPEAFEAMLRFMYGNNPVFQDEKKACELYRVAIKYEVNSLKQACRQFLNEVDVTPSNVFDILDASEYMGNKSRTDICLNMIQENTKEVMEAFDLSGVSPSMLNIFLDLPKMSLPSEYDLLIWVFAWGKNMYLENNKYNNIRDVLQPFLPKLNFLALTNEEFAKLCANQSDFFNDNEIISIFMNIGFSGSKKMPSWYDDKRPFRVYDESKQIAETKVSDF